MDNFKDYIIVRLFESKDESKKCYFNEWRIALFDTGAYGALAAIKHAERLAQEMLNNKEITQAIIDLNIGTLREDMTIKKWVVENGKVEIK